MRCTWLGQAGLLFEFDEIKVMVDPYLSDSVAKINPNSKRRVEVDNSFFDIKPDVLILTHDHLDHTDPETLDVLLKKWSGICILASKNAWAHVRSYGGSHNYILFNRGTQWTCGDICFKAVHAQHSDDDAIGVLIQYKNKTYYVTGDTLYHEQVFHDVKSTCQSIDALFLPVNGVGNNMNMIDAAMFAENIGAKKTIPIHFGLFDDLNPENDFKCQNKVVPHMYEEVNI